MATKLTITKLDGTGSVSIIAEITGSSRPIDFRNTAVAGVLNMDVPVDRALPFLTYKAIDGACVSGAAYARRKLGLAGLKIELLSFSWTGNVESAEGFSVAVMLAACKFFSNSLEFSEHELCGWRETDSS